MLADKRLRHQRLAKRADYIQGDTLAFLVFAKRLEDYSIADILGSRLSSKTLEEVVIHVTPLTGLSSWHCLNESWTLSFLGQVMLDVGYRSGSSAL